MKVFLLSLLILLMGIGLANAQPEHFGPPPPPADCDIYHEDTPGVVLTNKSKDDLIFAFSPQFSFRLPPGTSINLQDADIPSGFYSLMVSSPGVSTSPFGRIELRPGVAIVCY